MQKPPCGGLAPWAVATGKFYRQYTHTSLGLGSPFLIYLIYRTRIEGVIQAISGHAKSIHRVQAGIYHARHLYPKLYKLANYSGARLLGCTGRPAEDQPLHSIGIGSGRRNCQLVATGTAHGLATAPGAAGGASGNRSAMPWSFRYWTKSGNMGLPSGLFQFASGTRSPVFLYSASLTVAISGLPCHSNVR